MNILLTGCTRGLGRSLVEPFAALGHRVFGCGRSEDHISELRKLGPTGHFTAVDVTDNEAVQAWAKEVLAIAMPDLLVNNAAMMNDPAPLWKVPAEDFDRLIDVNVKGVANVIRAFVPVMVAARKGVIVNLSSGWGRASSPEVAPYCASKFAIEGMTKSLALELPAGMAAVPLNPGVIDTDMLRQCWADEAGQYQNAAIWARKAVPFLLALGAKDNGKSLSVG